MTEKKLFLSKEELRGYGCKNCVWKSFEQCPHGYTGDEGKKEGYCEELANFIFSLAEPEDKITAVKEKWLLQVQDMQQMADHMEYHKILKQYNTRKAEGASKQELAELQMGLISYRLWWERLVANVTKGYSRVADREQRKDNKLEIDHKISLTQIHSLANNAKKRLEEEKR